MKPRTVCLRFASKAAPSAMTGACAAGASDGAPPACAEAQSGETKSAAATRLRRPTHGHYGFTSTANPVLASVDNRAASQLVK